MTGWSTGGKGTTHNVENKNTCFTPPVKALAASAATSREIEEAKKNMGNTKPVEPGKRVWRPQVTSEYKEPDCVPDPLGDLEILYKEFGKPLWVNKSKLPPRDDIITFNNKEHQQEYEQNINWGSCPVEFRAKFEEIIKKYWDVFAEEGVRKNIRGALFHVDTGEVAPVCARPPRYGPHESRVINELVEKLEKNGIVEDDDGPWGAPIVLAAKANQEHLHWSKYVWRLCVSYRKLNAVTRPFTFPIIRCDDAVREIGDSKFFITMDLDSGYWQVACEERSRAKLAFFTPTGKKRFRAMPMGATNAHPVFVALVAKFKKEWDALAKDRGLQGCRSQVIVDDIILSARKAEVLIEYFVCVLEVLQHYRCTAKLRKCRFFPPVAEFVGLDIHAKGNAPAASKFKAFERIQAPKLFTDLNMLIGCFGFYQEHLPLFEVRIKRWRDIQKLRPTPGTPRDEEAAIMKQAWKEEDEDLLKDLKQEIQREPILKRPDSDLRFYLKTDWSKEAMGAALLQPDADCEKAMAAMTREVEGQACEFDATKSGLRLHPIAFISRRTSDPEKSYHSYVGEACAGLWAIEKFRPYLFGREFTWLTDCSGLRKFFEGDDLPTHMIQRWRMQLLRYDFTIVHRPGRMMFECDLLSRYNMWTEEWRKGKGVPEKQMEATKGVSALLAKGTTVQTKMRADPIPRSHQRVKFTTGGPKRSRQPVQGGQGRKKNRTALSENLEEEEDLKALEMECDAGRSVWVCGEPMWAIPGAAEDIGLDLIDHITVGDQNQEWVPWERAIQAAEECEKSPDWVIVPNAFVEQSSEDKLTRMLASLIWKGLSVVMIFHEEAMSPSRQGTTNHWNRWLRSQAEELMWNAVSMECNAAQEGGRMDSKFIIHILGRQRLVDKIRSDIGRKKRRFVMTEGPRPVEEILESGLAQGLKIFNEKHVDKQERKGGKPRVVSMAQISPAGEWRPVYAPGYPLPSFRSTSSRSGEIISLIEAVTEEGTRIVRSLTWEEASKILGIPGTKPPMIGDQRTKLDALERQVAKEAVRTVFSRILTAEEEVKWKEQTEAKGSSKYLSDKVRALRELTGASKVAPVFQTMLDRWTTIPLPTHKRWAEATENDPDLRMLRQVLQDGGNLERHRLVNKRYHDLWDKGQFETEEGLIYHTGEPRLTQVRQLRRRVVPKALRQIVLTAYHATPLAGHAGVYRTYWRIAARYWWPRMYLDVKEAVAECAHCRLTNAVGHEAKQVLEAISCETPFDVIAIDVWSPGDVPDKHGHVKALTSLDTMTGFASVAILQDMAAETVARETFAIFFVPNGLPKLILIDAGSENKGQLTAMCDTLGVKYHMVSPEDHNGILCERFHRYLNKVQKITAANTQSFTQWTQGVMFAAYSWNAAPIDGTNLIRSFVAKGRTFPFPLQVAEEDTPGRIPQGQGEEAIAHLETNFPLWAHQTTLLQILVMERRERHREMRNQDKSQRKFNIGDLVIIRKQVKSNAALGIPAKQRFKWKGIYKVLEKVGERSYKVQKQPSVQGKGKPGRPKQYSAAVMEKIPSSLVVSRHLDTSDTRLAALECPLVRNPLEQNLGFHRYGKYVKTPGEKDFVFDKIEDLWAVELEGDSSDEEEEPQTPAQQGAAVKDNLIRLYEETRDSRDKMFIIRMKMVPKTKHDWYMVQVDWEETEEMEAKLKGRYHLKWYMPHPGDSKKKITSNCRFWPEIHEALEDGSHGVIRIVSPGRASRAYVEDQGWKFYEWKMDLATDRLCGPFNFVHKGREPFHVAKEVWDELKQKADAHDVDLSNLHTVSPIK